MIVTLPFVPIPVLTKVRLSKSFVAASSVIALLPELIVTVCADIAALCVTAPLAVIFISVCTPPVKATGPATATLTILPLNAIAPKLFAWSVRLILLPPALNVAVPAFSGVVWVIFPVAVIVIAAADKGRLPKLPVPSSTALFRSRDSASSVEPAAQTPTFNPTLVTLLRKPTLWLPPAAK